MIIATDVPDYLYHYTSVDTLEKILMNKTIRFSSLMNVDDKEEILTSSGWNFGKYCFVSSWTDIEDESIPFWSEYTSNMSGVRIKLHTLPFYNNVFIDSRYCDGNSFYTYYPKELIEKQNICCYIMMPFCRRVQYTNDDIKIKIQDKVKYKYCDENTFRDFEANFMEIGKYKRKCWEFQSEWRYCMYFIPIDVNLGEPHFDLSLNTLNLDFNHYDLPIAEEFFLQLEITTGPRMGESDRKRVRKLVDQYCPTAKISESKLQIRI